MYTGYDNGKPLLEDSDVLLLFSEHGGLRFGQFDDVACAQFHKIPVVLFSTQDGIAGSSTMGTEFCVWFGAHSEHEARLVFDAYVEEFGLEAMGNRYFQRAALLADLLQSSRSPIERKLILGLWQTILCNAEQIHTQYTIGSYRADIAIITHGQRIVIEADGHNFHERTKEQAQHDKKRDREMQTLGWRVMRFTGSEIYRDPVGCVSQVSDLLLALMKGVA